MRYQVNKATRRMVHQVCFHQSELTYTQNIPGRTQKVLETWGDGSAGDQEQRDGERLSFYSLSVLYSWFLFHFFAFVISYTLFKVIHFT